MPTGICLLLTSPDFVLSPHEMIEEIALPFVDLAEADLARVAAPLPRVLNSSLERQ